MVITLSKSELSPDFIEPVSSGSIFVALSVVLLIFSALFIAFAIAAYIEIDDLVGCVFLLVAFVTGVAGFSMLWLNGNESEPLIDDRNNQIAKVIDEKYGAKLIEPVFNDEFNVEKISTDDHEIIDHEGIRRTVTISLTKDNRDLVLTTHDGEIGQASQIKPIN